MANATHNRPRARRDDSPIVERGITGNVKWYSRQKGIGWIHCDDGREIFVHHSGLATKGFEELRDEQRVHFDIADGERGLKAVNVQVGEPPQN